MAKKVVKVVVKGTAPKENSKVKLTRKGGYPGVHMKIKPTVKK